MTSIRMLPLSLALLAAAPTTAQGLLALTADNQLVPFHTASPQLTGQAVPISGLQAGESVLGIDFRPANGQLYGLGSTSRLYRIDPGTGVAVQVGPVFSTPLNGTEFGFDFNPTVDRIRVVSDQDQNLRLHPDTGAVAFVDGTLAYATSDPNSSRNPNVTGAAYTNSFAGATSTTLFGIDTDVDSLVTQVPPNAGTLNTVGRLGRDVTSVAGFDILGQANVAYAALNTAGGSTTTQLYAIDLTNGAATRLGSIGYFATSGARVRGLAVVPAVPPAELVALTQDNRLVAFDAAFPWFTSVPIQVTGLQSGENLLGIDFRPATGQLYALGSTSRLYTIDPVTGMATQVGPVLSTPLNGSAFGFDFNPTVDRIRVVSDQDQNLRLHPDTGAVAFVDGTLAYATGDPNVAANPNVTGAAYTDSLTGATATTLFGIDTNLDVLVTQLPPNAGTLNTVGNLGVDATAVTGFDIAGGSGQAYAALQTPVGAGLHGIDLTSGAVRRLGNIGQLASFGASIRGLAVKTVPGLRLFGTATAGCSGLSTLGANGLPFAGNRDFEFRAGNAAVSAPSFFVASVNGMNPPASFGGLQIWVDPGSVIMIFPTMTAVTGTARVNVPLPATAMGLMMSVQFIFSDGCGPMGLAGTGGLQITPL